MFFQSTLHNHVLWKAVASLVYRDFALLVVFLVFKARILNLRCDHRVIPPSWPQSPLGKRWQRYPNPAEVWKQVHSELRSRYGHSNQYLGSKGWPPALFLGLHVRGQDFHLHPLGINHHASCWRLRNANWIKVWLSFINVNARSHYVPVALCKLVKLLPTHRGKWSKNLPPVLLWVTLAGSTEQHTAHPELDTFPVNWAGHFSH